MPRQLLAVYPHPSPRHDEMFEPSGAVRDHWRAMWDALVSSKPNEMRRRTDYVRRQVRENGITYNVYADPRGADRPWELDVLPFIVAADEWQQIERAIAQRAELLNRVLADLYGEQKLLREGLLPSALVFGHRGFLRPCHGITPPGSTYLHVYAADLARSPDGRWWVIADRTQAPSGAGYALENRLVISRVFPELFRDLKVQHLASFFRTLRDSLAHWAPKDNEPPLVVLLTPGPYNETYFEHAYLARYLGFPLVEGTDLTVRNGFVWLKSLSGLRRVSAILRRMDDDFSDPLELRNDSALGIPGLTHAARLGNVLVANALGTGVLEGGAILGYLPSLCERILGAPLAMPSVATWWCGEHAALEDAAGQIDKLVIKAAHPDARFEPVFGEDLDKREQAALVERMRARPHDYIAQELVHLAQAPVCDHAHPRQLNARIVGLRVFACASPAGYTVMPGGLTRAGSDADSRVLSMQRGGSSKDTWVLSSGPISTFSMLRRTIGAPDLVRSGANLSSRVAENLYWFGRYAERCDAVARLLRITLDRLIEDADQQDASEWEAIIGLCRLTGLLPDDEAMTTPMPGLNEHLVRAMLDGERSSSLAANLGDLFQVAFQLRERLSIDNWRTINRLVQELSQREDRTPTIGEAFDFLDRAVLSLMTLAGFAMDGMTRDAGWRFLSIGRRIERLQFLCLALRHALTTEDGELDWVLELADSIVTYRSRYMARPERLPVFDLLMLDRGNPRSVIFQVSGVADYLSRLAEQFGAPVDNPIARLLARLADFDLAACLETGGGAAQLDRLLRDIDSASYRLSDQLALRFFTHVERGRQTVSV